ncbi:Rossmann-like and DUF2520 domain-containing protein [Croceitalea marina]|uniref:Rossmann-like and DUF2520 domain-containing protein n=1 Tax=Croceitalea marina TaxID=1775166 RepID=A0ABW5MUU9_9FLAO
MKFVLLRMLSVVLIGTGNVAHHLFDAFYPKEDIQVIQVFGRNIRSLSSFEAKCAVTSVPENIIDADVYIVAVNDDAISEVSKLLVTKKGMVVHTSGSVSKDNVVAARKGVFYPLQTFSPKKEVDFSSIPICIEADTLQDLKILEVLAHKISERVHLVSSAQREKLHLAAVFVNNFTNHMYVIGQEICSKEELPFDLLKPLISETANKLRFLSPDKAQTGPAKRNDILTMQKHLDALENPIQKKLYQLISESIKEQNEKKL